MGVPTQYFVDPGVAPGGAGTAADPWDTIAVALAAIVRDAADGDQINVVSDQLPGVTTTTDDIFAATITLVAYGVPAVDAPLIFRGCSRTPDPVTGLPTGLPVANNGGIGGIDGNAGGFSIYDGQAGATDYVHFIDMHLYNTAAANAVYLGNRSTAINCEVDTSGVRGIRTLDACRIFNCYLHDCVDDTILIANRCWLLGNYMETGGVDGIDLGGIDSVVDRNIIVTTAVGTEAVNVSQARNMLIGNSIFSTVVGTTAGINFDANTHEGCVIVSNLIEGFSDPVTGAGINFNNLLRHIELYANNSFYNNGNDERNRGDINYEADNDLLMPASPFLKQGARTFANRFNYFKPAIPVRGRAFPNGCRFDRGAVQVRLATEREIAAVTITSIPARTELDPL